MVRIDDGRNCETTGTNLLGPQAVGRTEARRTKSMNNGEATLLLKVYTTLAH